jgi:hypothetical protein
MPRGSGDLPDLVDARFRPAEADILGHGSREDLGILHYRRHAASQGSLGIIPDIPPVDF